MDAWFSSRKGKRRVWAGVQVHLWPLKLVHQLSVIQALVNTLRPNYRLFPKQSQCNRFDVLNAFHTTNIQYLLYVCKCTMCVFLHSLVKFINHKHIWEHFVSYSKCCCFPSNSPSYRMICVHVHHFSHNLRGEGQMLNNFLFKQF